MSLLFKLDTFLRRCILNVFKIWKKSVNINITLKNIVLHIMDKKLRWASASSSLTGSRFSQECAGRSLARHVVRSELSAGGIWDFHYLCLFMSLASCAVTYFSDHVLWSFKIISNLYQIKLVFFNRNVLVMWIDRPWPDLNLQPYQRGART